MLPWIFHETFALIVEFIEMIALSIMCAGAGSASLILAFLILKMIYIGRFLCKILRKSLNYLRLQQFEFIFLSEYGVCSRTIENNELRLRAMYSGILSSEVKFE